MEKISVKLYKNISFEKWTFPMLVPQERTPAGSVARCSHSYCLWKYSSLHSLHMAFCPELGHLQKGVSLGSQQVTWCQVVAPTLWLFFCHWMHRCHGGKGGEQYLVFVLDCGLVELQSMKSHPPLWLPAMISTHLASGRCWGVRELPGWAPPVACLLAWIEVYEK